jgi:hypothetical protein
MSIKEQIKALRRGKNGNDILSILNAITGDFKELSTDKELVIGAILPDPGYIITYDGRQVSF